MRLRTDSQKIGQGKTHRRQIVASRKAAEDSQGAFPATFMWIFVKKKKKEEKMISFEAGGCVSMRHGSIIMTLISQLSLSVDISKEGSEGGFHFWTCFVGFTVVPLCHVWLSTTRLTGTTHPAFKKPTCGGHVRNTGFKLRVISACSCLDLLVCRRAGRWGVGGHHQQHHLFADLLFMF